jgi:Asp-tRNA(Asn)/Glu-tRNA(Gln) amidotransferase A subunit family amidase
MPGGPEKGETHTLAGIRRDLRTHRTTCVAVVAQARDRIAALDRDGPALRAMISLSDDALARAADLDEEYARTGTLRPAHGVPIVVKDCIDTAAMPTTFGSPLFARHRPVRDATLVNRLTAAGAIIVGKANLDDFAASVFGVSSIAGPMPNPYDRTRTVGGSSGGSAVAVSAGYVPLAIGTDAGGSLRIPSAFTNVVTIRPSLGLVSRAGVLPRSPSQDTPGPIARTVADAAAGLDLLAGVDPADPLTARCANRLPAGGYARSARPPRSDLAGVRLGLIRSGLALFGADDQSVMALLEQACTDLRALGATVVDVAGPDRDLLGAGSLITLESRAGVDAYLAAAGPSVPVRTFAELHESGAYTDHAKVAFDRELRVDPATAADSADYRTAQGARAALRDWTLATLAERQLDAFCYASATRFPESLGIEQGGVFTRLSEHTGFPAIGIPMGFGGAGSDSLPASLELLGRAFSEPRLIEIAAAYEAATRHRRPPAFADPLPRGPE